MGAIKVEDTKVIRFSNMTKFVFNEDQTIIFNRLNGQWVKVPKQCYDNTKQFMELNKSLNTTPMLRALFYEGRAKENKHILDNVVTTEFLRQEDKKTNSECHTCCCIAGYNQITIFSHYYLLYCFWYFFDILNKNYCISSVFMIYFYKNSFLKGQSDSNVILKIIYF